MEDHLDTLLYLIISIVYALFRYSRKHATEEKEEMLDPYLPTSTATPVWEEIVPPTPAPIASSQATKTASASPTSSSSPPVSQQPRLDRVLSRYKGWQKAMIMRELLRPPT